MSAIIVTATIAQPDFAGLDGLRRAHFPPDRNRVPAHITLFHHLPPSAERELMGRLKPLTAAPAPPARLGGLIDLGNGVAFRVDSPQLADLRAELAHAFAGLLTPQDRATPRLHVTVQNKVPRAEARALLDELGRDFRVRPVGIAGLAIWRYMGGPWEPIREYRFRR